MKEEQVTLSFGVCTIRGATSGEYRQKQLYLGMKIQRVEDELTKRVTGISPRAKVLERRRLVEKYTDEADEVKAELGVLGSFELTAKKIIEYEFNGSPKRENLPQYLMDRGEDDIVLIEQALKRLSSVSEDEIKNSGGLSSKGRKSKTLS